MKKFGLTGRLLALLFATMSIFNMMFGACSNDNFRNADVKEFATLIADTAQVQILDVRTADEFQEGHIQGAVLCDVTAPGFEEKVQSLIKKDKPVAVYCRSGKRSAMASAILKEAGYDPVNLLGGILAWEDAQMPVVEE